MQPTADYLLSRPDVVGQTRQTDWRLGIPVYVYAVVFSSLCVVVGLLWDIMWHMSIGRDGLLSAPHLVIYVGAIVSGLFSGYQILSLTFRRNHPDRPASVKFWGVFYGSLGAMFCVWGAIAMLTSAPFDDWWHNAYGLDVQILTPPHTILALGIMMVQFGAMIGVLALQNRAANSAVRSQAMTPELAAKQANRLKMLFAIAAGLLLAVLFTLVSENVANYAAHNSSYYLFAGIVFPVYLLAVGRASLLRYPLTTIALVYMLTLLVPSWVIQFFPATPKLGPVLNPITTYQPFVFPLLLVIPGFVLDKLTHRFVGKLNDWVLSVVLAVAFMAVLLVVQWPFEEFTLTSPLARNWFFMSYSWVYAQDPNWEYRYAFAPWMQQTPIQFAQGFGIALVAATVSARVGLWWGSWMKRVMR